MQWVYVYTEAHTGAVEIRYKKEEAKGLLESALKLYFKTDDFTKMEEIVKQKGRWKKVHNKEGRLVPEDVVFYGKVPGDKKDRHVFYRWRVRCIPIR